MNQQLLLFTFLFFPFCGFSTPVLPSDNCLLIDHLMEVNAEWATKNYTDALLFEPYHFDNDRDRIQKHLELVTYFLNKENGVLLTESQFDNRKKQLLELTNYWQAKQFPVNTRHAQRQPYFVDDFGTACAVGHLVLESGEQALVERISKEMNYAYLRHMPYSELGTWAKKYGFTVDELAWIQPSYQPQGYKYNQVGNNEGIEGRVNVLTTSPDGSLLFFGGSFNKVDGIDCNNLIAFDGENWLEIENNIDGEIFDMEFRNDTALYIVGNFDVDGYENLTVYNLETETFSPYGISQMEGTIYTVLATSGLRIGGDFAAINGEEFQNLAFWDWNIQSWTNRTRYFDTNGFHYIDNAFSVNGVVKDMVYNSGNILVGGMFNLTAPSLDTSYVQNLEVKNLAYWTEGFGDWTEGFDGNYGEIECLSIDFGGLYVGANNINGSIFAQLSGGFWFDYNYSSSTETPIVNDLTFYKDAIIITGDFFALPGIGDISRNMLGLKLGEPGGYRTDIDQEVWATTVFQDKLYLAGAFENLDGFLLNNIATTELEPNIFNNTADIITQSDNVYTADNQLFVKDFSVSKNTQLSLYNLQGQLVETFTLAAGQSNFQYSLAHLNSGVMVYYIETEEGTYSGKILK